MDRARDRAEGPDPEAPIAPGGAIRIVVVVGKRIVFPDAEREALRHRIEANWDHVRVYLKVGAPLRIEFRTSEP